ncbi:MAG: chemotaxis-specific protein-glutamate methyltransferase CheB [Cyanobacteria bacterium J06621_11]
MIRVAIANDTLIALSALRQAIATNPAYELIWWAKDGCQAVELCAKDTPDLMLMDLLMPGLDGVEATKQIMAHSPCAILIVTGSVRNNTSKIFEAMGHGALDVVSTPVFGVSVADPSVPGASVVKLPVSDAAKPLLEKMATVTAFIGKSIRRQKTKKVMPRSRGAIAHLPHLIVIGASTGGPKALAQILQGLPVSLPAAVVIIQHIDEQFASGLVSWLNAQSNLPVRLAVEGAQIRPGQVYVAAGGQHLVMGRDRALHYIQSGAQGDHPLPYRPSVDVFFNSVAQHWPHRGQAALLTGMGRDGAVGLGTLRSAAWQTIAESEESCIVYGMPRAAVESAAACQVLPVNAISQALLEGLA